MHFFFSTIFLYKVKKYLSINNLYKKYLPVGPFRQLTSTLRRLPSGCRLVDTLLIVCMSFITHFHTTFVICYYLHDCQNRFMICTELSALFVGIQFLNLLKTVIRDLLANCSLYWLSVISRFACFKEISIYMYILWL